MKQVFNVIGMNCTACANHVNNAINAISGVDSVDVNALTAKVTIEYDDSVCSFYDFKCALNKIGYDLSQENITIKKDIDLIKLIVSFFILIITMIISMGDMIGIMLPTFINKELNPINNVLLQLILIIPVVIMYRNYYISGLKKLFKLIPNMESLISIGSIASLIYGIYGIVKIILGDISFINNLYLDSSAMILFFVSMGKYFEKLSKKKTFSSIEELIKLKPKTAKVVLNNSIKEELVENVQIGSIIEIKKGDQIPLDGVVIKGSGVIDESSITGESLPKEVTNDSLIYSSSILLDGYLLIKTTKVDKNSTISRIIDLVNEASNSKAPISKLVDKISNIFVPIVLGISFITLIVWIIISKDIDIAFNNSISVLVVACPCSLGLATPVAIMVGSGKAAKLNLLIKNASIFEKAKDIDCVIFDKTGTLTKGNLKVENFDIFNYDYDVLSIGYSLDQLSNHPIAKSICNYAISRYTETLDVSNMEEITGFGVKGIINNQNYYIGKPLKDYNNSIINKYLSIGLNVITICKDEELLGIITLSDEIKESSKYAVEYLKQLNIHTVMVTGDNELVANRVVNVLGIDEVYSNKLPTDKISIVNEYLNKYNTVSFVGDGINDAPALAKSSVGISVGTATDISLITSDIIILSSDIVDVVNTIKLSKKVYRIIIGNLLWAFCYNIIGIFTACGLLSFIGLTLNPMIASLAMSISSVLVVTNALRINLFKEIKYKRNSIKVTYKINGMMCEHCEAKVIKQAKSIENVINAYASYKKGILTIEYINSINEDKLKAYIKEIGYTVLERI